MFENVKINKVKDYWDRRPCNIRHSTSKIGTRQYFDEVERRKYFVEPHIPDFAQFEQWRGKRVLEIGCGIGTDTINFARGGAKVTAVDISEKSLALAKKRAEIYGLSPKIEFYCADAENLFLTVPPKAYDLIYSFGVIHHTPHPENVIKQVRENYVKSGSKLKIMIYYRYSWKVLWILLAFGKGAFWNLDDIVARHSEAQTGCPVTYTYSKREVVELLNGFSDINLHAEHIFPYRISDYIQYKYKKVWYFRYLPTSTFHLLERLFGWHLCVTAEVP